MNGLTNAGQYNASSVQAVQSREHINMHVCVCLCVCVCVFCQGQYNTSSVCTRCGIIHTHTHTTHASVCIWVDTTYNIYIYVYIHTHTHNTCMYRGQYNTSSLQGCGIMCVCVCACVCACVRACVRVKTLACIGVNSIQAACKRCGVTKRRGRPPSNADSENMVSCISLFLLFSLPTE